MSAGSLIGTVINTLFIGTFCGVIGYLIDFITIQANLFTLSPQTMLTMYYVTLIFYAFPFLYFFANVVHHIVISLNEQTGAV